MLKEGEATHKDLIKRHEQMETECSKDPRYQKLAQKYHMAVNAHDWKTAHDFLVKLDIVEARFRRGDWVLNGQWIDSSPLPPRVFVAYR